MQFFVLSLISASLASATLTTHSFVEVDIGTTSFVPVDASINNENKLVYTTRTGGTSTSTFTNSNGWMTTSVDGGDVITTTAATNIASEVYTLTTTLAATQQVKFGEYYTTTTYDDAGTPHTVYVRQDPFIQYTTTSWDENGSPHTLYLSATTKEGTTSFSTIDGTVDGMFASSPTTDSSLTSYTNMVAGGGTYSVGIATSSNNAGHLTLAGAGAGMTALLGILAAFCL